MVTTTWNNLARWVTVAALLIVGTSCAPEYEREELEEREEIEESEGLEEED